ncbi:FG-GAP repeat protein [Ferrimonas futtsuensis]|uniref:FG-GAP repeat protein n=1 Tax=Ferrimonas futtsuensis TaxID=364764 RepID=UPI0004871B8C|nr:FG-GAP repeat protein [Ferrimonas futtsuensis]
MYLIERDDRGNWTQSDKWSACEDRCGFGAALALSGNRAVIGAVRGLADGQHSGTAYLYEYGQEGWRQTAVLSPSDGGDGLSFGSAVALGDDRVLVGARLDDDNGRFAGAVYRYEYDGIQWTEVGKLLGSDGAEFDQIGAQTSVALMGNTALLGAYGHQHSDGEEASGGAVYLHDLSTQPRPSIGIVAGGALTSPAGALVNSPDSAGQAQFALMSRLSGTDTIPRSTLRFSLNKGGFEFRSTDSVWLYSTGTSARLVGKGVVNGGGRFEYAVSLTSGRRGDSAPDSLRIQIWDEAHSGQKVYDNQPGDPKNHPATAPIDQGATVIHASRIKDRPGN